MIGWADVLDDVFAMVYREMRLTPAHPVTLTPPPRHTTRALDHRYVRPVIRSWIGGRTTDPHHPPHPHTIPHKALTIR